MGHKLSNNHKDSISKSLTGRKLSESHRAKIAEGNRRRKLSKETKEKIRQSKLGKKRSEETKAKIAEGMRKYAIEHYNFFPNYNPKACKIIDEYGKEHGFNFQHALNGGEYYIKELGYWVDGYDEERNVVIEYYEKFHEKQKEHDLNRQKEIQEFLKCEFLVIKEF